MATKEYVPAPAGISLTPGEMLRVTREAQELTQAQLAALSGIPQPTISALEGGHESIGIERAEKLARALKVHPAVIVWPDWPAAPSSPRTARAARRSKVARAASRARVEARRRAKA